MKLQCSNYLPNAGHNEGEARQRVFGDELVEVLDQKKKSERTEIRRETGVEPDEFEAETRRRLTAAGIFPEAIEVELGRVMDRLFGMPTAQGHRAASH